MFPSWPNIDGLRVRIIFPRATQLSALNNSYNYPHIPSDPRDSGLWWPASSRSRRPRGAFLYAAHASTRTHGPLWHRWRNRTDAEWDATLAFHRCSVCTRTAPLHLSALASIWITWMVHLNDQVQGNVQEKFCKKLQWFIIAINKLFYSWRRKVLYMYPVFSISLN